jgi:hypothetical protein
MEKNNEKFDIEFLKVFQESEKSKDADWEKVKVHMEKKYPIESDARLTPPSFDEMVGLIKKLFTDYLEDVMKTPPSQIAEAWERYSCLNHLYQDEQAQTSAVCKPVTLDSKWMIGRSEERFKELEHYGWDWRSFYNGWIESRAEAIQDLLAREKASAGVWVEAETRLPDHSNLVHINYTTGITKFKLTGFYKPSSQKWHRQSGEELQWSPNLEWLDESSEILKKEKGE